MKFDKDTLRYTTPRRVDHVRVRILVHNLGEPDEPFSIWVIYMLCLLAVLGNVYPVKVKKAMRWLS